MLGISGKPVDVWFDVGALNLDGLYSNTSIRLKNDGSPTHTLRSG